VVSTGLGGGAVLAPLSRRIFSVLHIINDQLRVYNNKISYGVRLSLAAFSTAAFPDLPLFLGYIRS